MPAEHHLRFTRWRKLIFSDCEVALSSSVADVFHRLQHPSFIASELQLLSQQQVQHQLRKANNNSSSSDNNNNSKGSYTIGSLLKELLGTDALAEMLLEEDEVVFEEVNDRANELLEHFRKCQTQKRWRTFRLGHVDYPY